MNDPKIHKVLKELRSQLDGAVGDLILPNFVCQGQVDFVIQLYLISKGYLIRIVISQKLNS